MVAITQFSRENIFDAVMKMYTDVAQKPEMGFHFPTGRPACEFLGYPAEQLDAIPATAIESFAGVGYPFRCNAIEKGHTVLDIGAGAGTDVFISTLLTGDTGKVYGLDMTQAMQDKLRENIQKMGTGIVEPLFGNAEQIPLDDGTVDVVTSNGVLNLVPDKPQAFAEIYRVLKPGGRIQISDIVINKSSEELDESKSNPKLWAECIVGALEEQIYVYGLTEAGLTDVEIVGRNDYFSRSSNESTRNVAKYFDARSITLSGRKA
ncbi:MAG: methyltransferase domain-containing protein [Gammaproteobacteria bacterium]|nr:methyltransferase domain-containing protein [Gammaproteobacteria bacterium]